MKPFQGCGWGVLALGLAWPAAIAAQGTQLNVHGLIDLVLDSGGAGLAENYYNRGPSNFDPYNVRIFVDADVGSGFQVFTQVVVNEVTGLEPFGAYVLWTPAPGRDLHLQAGKIPWPVGTWAPRTYSNRNPLIGIPMMYQYHTSLIVNGVPADADELLAAAGSGQYGPPYGAGWRGMPLIYDRCWDYGAVLTGSARPVEYALGITNGAPAAAVAGEDWNDGKSVLGRVGVLPLPWLRLGVSGAVGPYLPEFLEASEPALAGRDVDDFDQRLLMADLEVLFGHYELRAEAYANTWETATVGELDVRGGYLEGKATVAPGVYLAGRYEVMRFGDLAGATLPEQPWDHDRDRWEVGVGYRATRNAVLKAVFQRNVERIPGQDDVHRDLSALQLALAF
jgi:hypothetical protein